MAGKVRIGYRKPGPACDGAAHFEGPDTDRFPCLNLAYEAARIGGTMPAVLNAADEIVVERIF